MTTLITWLCIIGLGGMCIFQRLKIMDYEEKDKKLVSTLSMIDRWFCNDYEPILIITEYIKERVFEDANESMSELRDRARKRNGNRRNKSV